MNNIDSHCTLGKVHKGGMSLVIAGFFFFLSQFDCSIIENLQFSSWFPCTDCLMYMISLRRPRTLPSQQNPPIPACGEMEADSLHHQPTATQLELSW